MSALRRTLTPALAAAALAAFALAPSASAATPGTVVTAGGAGVTACTDAHGKALLIHVHRVNCVRALLMADAATVQDRACPTGWRARHVKLKVLHRGRHVSGPPVTLCTKGSGKRLKAFTYHLPIG